MLIKDILTVTALLVSQVSAHGLVTRIKGANGVDMPGLTSEPILLPALLWLVILTVFSH
jgi:hypothetical protein